MHVRDTAVWVRMQVRDTAVWVRMQVRVWAAGRDSSGGLVAFRKWNELW